MGIHVEGGGGNIGGGGSPTPWTVTAPSDGSVTLVQPNASGVWPVTLVEPSTSGATDETRAHVIFDLTHPRARVGHRMFVKQLHETPAAPNREGAVIGAIVDTPAVLGDFAALSPSTLDFSAGYTYGLGSAEVVLDEDFTGPGGGALLGAIVAQLDGYAELRTQVPVTWGRGSEPVYDDLPAPLTFALVTIATGDEASLEVTAPPGDPLGLAALDHTPGLSGDMMLGVERDTHMAGHGNPHMAADSPKNPAEMQNGEFIICEDYRGRYLGFCGTTLRGFHVIQASLGDVVGEFDGVLSNYLVELEAAVAALQP